MTFRLCLLSFCLVLHLNSCTSNDPLQDVDFGAYQPPQPVGGGTAPSNYRTTVGDTLDIFVLEDSSFNGKYVVRPSGDIIIPKLGRITVGSLSLAETEAAIKRALELSQLKKATVIADPVLRGAETGETMLTGLTIYMSGSVAKAGRKFVPFVGGNNVTAFQAVMDSGGFTNFANKKKSFVLRRIPSGGTQRMPLDFTKIESGKTPDVPLQDGDMLVVPQKSFGF
jgi:polysaccharide biosynthesis/export protein